MENTVENLPGYYVHVKKVIYETHFVYAKDEEDAIESYIEYGETIDVEVESDGVVAVVLDERYADVDL